MNKTASKVSLSFLTLSKVSFNDMLYNSIKSDFSCAFWVNDTAVDFKYFAFRLLKELLQHVKISSLSEETECPYKYNLMPITRLLYSPN